MLYRDYGYLKIGRGLCLLQSRDSSGCKYVSSNLLHQKNVLKRVPGVYTFRGKEVNIHATSEPATLVLVQTGRKK